MERSRRATRIRLSMTGCITVGSEAVKGNEEALNDNGKALQVIEVTLEGDEEALKGNELALKGDGKAFNCNEEASKADADALRVTKRC